MITVFIVLLWGVFVFFASMGIYAAFGSTAQLIAMPLFWILSVFVGIYAFRAGSLG